MQLKFQSIELLLYVSTGCTSKKIIICAKLHVFLSMCHTMQWSNGLTFFMTEDLHFDEQQNIYNLYTLFLYNYFVKLQEFQPFAIVCNSSNAKSIEMS